MFWPERPARSIMRAFIVEEQKIVKKVLQEKLKGK